MDENLLIQPWVVGSWLHCGQYLLPWRSYRHVRAVVYLHACGWRAKCLQVAAIGSRSVYLLMARVQSHEMPFRLRDGGPCRRIL